MLPEWDLALVVSTVSGIGTFLLAIVAFAQFRVSKADKQAEIDRTIIKEILEPTQRDLQTGSALPDQSRWGQWDHRPNFSRWQVANSEYPLLVHRVWRRTRRIAEETKERFARVEREFQNLREQLKETIFDVFFDFGLKDFFNDQLTIEVKRTDSSSYTVGHRALFSHWIRGVHPIEHLLALVPDAPDESFSLEVYSSSLARFNAPKLGKKDILALIDTLYSKWNQSDQIIRYRRMAHELEDWVLQAIETVSQEIYWRSRGRRLTALLFPPNANP